MTWKSWSKRRSTSSLGQKELITTLVLNGIYSLEPDALGKLSTELAEQANAWSLMLPRSVLSWEMLKSLDTSLAAPLNIRWLFSLKTPISFGEFRKSFDCLKEITIYCCCCWRNIKWSAIKSGKEFANNVLGKWTRGPRKKIYKKKSHFGIGLSVHIGGW